MTHYTKGPWRVDNNHGYLWVESDCEDLTVKVARGIGSELDKANARLIAAAPSLLETLQELLAYCEEEGHSWAVMYQAKADIERATGVKQP